MTSKAQIKYNVNLVGHRISFFPTLFNQCSSELPYLLFAVKALAIWLSLAIFKASVVYFEKRVGAAHTNTGPN